MLLRDVIVGARQLTAHPRFSLTAIAVLGIGIGATTTVFSIANVPVPASANLRAGPRDSRLPQPDVEFLRPDYVDLRDRNRTLEGLAAYQVASVSLRDDGRPQHTYGEIVTDNYFSLLGVRPVVGRMFSADDGRAPGAHPVVVISYALWQRRFGGDPQSSDEASRSTGMRSRSSAWRRPAISARCRHTSRTCGFR
jgi:MacB-like periplasmic core domain